MTNLEQLKLGIYEKAIPLQLSWEQKLTVAKQAGYDFVEFSVDGLEPRINRLDWQEEQIAEVRRAVENTGIPLLTMALTANRYYPLGESRPELRNRGIEIVRAGIDLAVKLGIRIIQLAPYDVNGDHGNEHTRELFVQALRELAGYGAQNGVMLCIEVMDKEVKFCSSVEMAMGIIKQVDSPFLQIYTDTGNVAATGADPVPDIAFGGRHIVATHLKDATIGCCRKVEFGSGIVDFEACLKAFKAMDYNGLFVAEMWSDEDEGFIPYLSVAAEFIREKIKIANR